MSIKSGENFPGYTASCIGYFRSVQGPVHLQCFLGTIVVVPANCTDRLQPLDVSLNKSAKEFLRKFHEWYADQVRLQLRIVKTNLYMWT